MGIWLYFAVSWKLITLSSSVEKILQEHPVNTGAQQGSRLGPMLPQLCIADLPSVSGLVISMLQKISLFSLTGLITVLLM